ncbi:MAG: UbiD family decarboxylase [Pedobacter sp.]|nr:MAG: UbiD family decarboxylase [Pedobacter sp.]
MGYKNMAACIADLEKHGHLIRIKEEVDPNLEMAVIHLKVYAEGGPAILFENVKGSEFPAVSNLFGTLDRSKFMFRDSLQEVKNLVALRSDPMQVLKKPFSYIKTGITALQALPLKQHLFKATFSKTTIDKLPLIKHWPMDGGAFITMPQVYTEDVNRPGPMNSNLGMYRIQLNGNDYTLNKEIGLHYQIHRGIGIHQAKANALGKPLKVSVFVGGPPAHALAAVMPLPEGLSELTFAGALGGRRFRYFYDEEGFMISADADFVITGTVYPDENKDEGPFGDHLGYYSLAHPFPVLKVHNVYHKKDAIWNFTVVGRPPQEDTSFGALIHEITGSAMPKEIPGLKEVNAVDAAGVHPLLFAIGSERYTPYLKIKRPQELLTIANHILGKNQLSLAKYLFIAAQEDNPDLKTSRESEFISHILERIDWNRDIHFYTQTTIDTLDYSGDGLNAGSKVVFAAVGDKIRELGTQLPDEFTLNPGFHNPQIAIPGVICINAEPYTEKDAEMKKMENLSNHLGQFSLSGFPLIVLCDDSEFVASTLNNLLWITFTRSNPAADIYGVKPHYIDKHWGCEGPLIIDARKKPHHAPELILDTQVESNIKRFWKPNGAL